MALVSEKTIQTEWSQLVGEVSANLFADRGCDVVSATDPYGRILGSLDRSSYVFFEVAPQLYPVPDPLLFRKSGSVGNWTRISGSVARNSDH
jgi:hypothetical protein